MIFRIGGNNIMYIQPKELFLVNGKTPVYKCTCGHIFQRLELLSNKRWRGTFNYCPICKVKFKF